MAEENGRVCAVCGKALTGRQERYCSKQCKKNAERKRALGEQHDAKYTKVCQNCGNEFVTEEKSRRKYCSDECVKEAHEAQVARYRIKKRAEKKKLVKICAWCGKEFEARNASAKYCSDACFKLARSAKAHEKYMAMLQTPEGKERSRKGAQNREAKTKMCAICGKEFEAKNTVTKYCSDACRKKAAIIHAAQWKERIMETPEGREKFMERTKMYTETQKSKPEYVEKYKAKLGKYKENYRLKRKTDGRENAPIAKNGLRARKALSIAAMNAGKPLRRKKRRLWSARGRATAYAQTAVSRCRKEGISIARTNVGARRLRLDSKMRIQTRADDSAAVAENATAAFFISREGRVLPRGDMKNRR